MAQGVGTEEGPGVEAPQGGPGRWAGPAGRGTAMLHLSHWTPSLIPSAKSTSQHPAHSGERCRNERLWFTVTHGFPATLSKVYHLGRRGLTS